MVSKIIIENNKLNIFNLKEMQKNQPPPSSCFRRSVKFKQFYKHLLQQEKKILDMKDEVCCILTGNTDNIKITYIVKNKSICNDAVLWVLHDMIWCDISDN